MSRLAKFLVGLGVVVVALLPAGISTLIYFLIGPEDFWQSAVVVGVGIYLCGGVQILFGLAAIGILIWLIFFCDDY